MRELGGNIEILTYLIGESKTSPPKFLSDFRIKLIEAWKVAIVQIAFKFDGTFDLIKLFLVREGKLSALDVDAERLRRTDVTLRSL